MPADPIHPDQLAGQARFRADLVAYLDRLPLGELAELLGELPSSRQQPLGLGVLMVALNEWLPDGYELLPPGGHPGPGEGRRRSLREVVADRRAGRAGWHDNAPPSGLADRQRQVDLQAERAWAGAVGARRVAEALRAWFALTPTRWPASKSPATCRPSRGSVIGSHALVGSDTDGS
jgi:hypothetical protein